MHPRRTRRAWRAAIALTLLVGGTGSALAAQPAGPRPAGPAPAIDLTSLDLTSLPGIGRLPASGVATGVATLGAPAAAGHGRVVDALGDLGLRVQPLRRLPLALVRGPVDSLRAAVVRGLVADVYPDERLQLHDRTSSDAMGAAIPRASRFTGKGVTVAVVDSGCDATHPDLADHVTHNVKVVSAEYANVVVDGAHTIAIPLDEGPYSNTDLGSGHGTHVAGIIAADGTTDPANVGVAPDAELVCVAMGEGIFTTAVVTAYDFLLDQPGLWGIDVVNNSWGNSFANFDPRHPVNVATRAIAEHGVDVVFSSSNSGSANGRATLNPFSQAPWVLSVAATTVAHERAGFSSNGLPFDNSEPVAVGPGGRTTFRGHRIGVYHPDVAAPGVDISATCDTLGIVAIGPCPPGEQTTASGTSMSAPHVAGAIAVLLPANPALTNEQVRAALQTTARPVIAVDDEGEATDDVAPFWQVGYGRVDLAKAVDAARRRPAQLLADQAALEARLLRATSHVVERSDVLSWDAPRLTIGSDVRRFTVPLSAGVTDLDVTVAFPSESTAGDADLTSYTARVTDARGRVLVEGTVASGEGTTSAFGRVPPGVRGPLTVVVTGDFAASDPDTLDSDSVMGDTIVAHVAQLRRR